MSARPVTAWEVLADEQHAAVLGRLLVSHPELRAEADDAAIAVLSDVDRAEVAGEVCWAVESVSRTASPPNATPKCSPRCRRRVLTPERGRRRLSGGRTGLTENTRRVFGFDHLIVSFPEKVQARLTDAVRVA